MNACPLFGSTRSVLKSRYALLTPDGLVSSLLPGWEKTACHVVISPGMGARFCQIVANLEAEGRCAGNTGSNQFFFYVIEGAAGLMLDDRRHRLDAGSYAYVPPGKDLELRSSAAATRVILFQKPYEPLPGAPRPTPIIGHERDVKGQPYFGKEAARLQVLLPDQPSFDMAINIFTFQPGATLPSVETHIMEHGLMMLRGQGIYRLDADWHPVQAGDVLWMAPYCPQWFVAMENSPASFICYKDVNRDPI
jgi:(S)-ureidoglycine aminohydrolase